MSVVMGRRCSFACARILVSREIGQGTQATSVRARDGGGGASELVVGDGEDGGNGVGEEKACKSVREPRAGVIERNGLNMPKAETP